MAGKNKYTEPSNYIPDAIQKKNKVGKYSETLKKEKPKKKTK